MVAWLVAELKPRQQQTKNLTAHAIKSMISFIINVWRALIPFDRRSPSQCGLDLKHFE
jgi:hypothetical protein